MSRLVTFLLLATLFLSVEASAQTQTAGTQQSVRISLKDGAFRRKGVMMRIQSGKITRLTAPFSLPDGTTISPDGQVAKADGTQQQLPDGRAINMQGEIVGLSDDMLTATTIQQLDQLVTGYTGTVVSVPNAVPADAAAALKRLEQKAELVQQLTDRLAERTALAVPASPEATDLDNKIHTIDIQIKP